MEYREIVDLIEELEQDAASQSSQIIQSELRHPDCTLSSAKYNQGVYDGIVLMASSVKFKLKALREESD